MTQNTTAAYHYFRQIQTLQQDLIRFAADRELTVEEIQGCAAVADKWVAEKFGFTIRSLFV